MYDFLCCIDCALDSYSEETEKAIREYKEFKYIARPIYKICVTEIGPAATTAITFLFTDLIVHQLLHQAIRYSIIKVAKLIIPNDWSDTFGLKNYCFFSNTTLLRI